MMSDCECVEVKCPEGIPAWVMTFADLMSLLLAFFVLLFSFSEMDKNVYKELAGSLKDAFGVQREIKAKETPRGINIIAREFSPGRPVPTVMNEVRQMTTDESRLHPVFTDASDKGQENQDKKSDAAEDKQFNAMTEHEAALLRKIEADAESIKNELNEEIKKGLIDVDVKDKRIILRIREKGAFPSGSADIIQPFNAITGKISKVFSGFDGKIIVSGHTDNIPIKTARYRSNWELSASRAVSVIHALRRNKTLGDKRFEMTAFADTQPVDTNDTYLGRVKNRRVEIMLDYSENPKLVPVQDAATGQYLLKTVPEENDDQQADAVMDAASVASDVMKTAAENMVQDQAVAAQPIDAAPLEAETSELNNRIKR